MEFFLGKWKKKQCAPYGSSILLRGASGSGKSLLVEQICQQYDLNLRILAPAKVFLAGGRQTAVSMIKSLFIKAAVRQEVVLIERCDELLSKDSDAESLAYTIASWLNQKSLLVICTTSMPIDNIHAVWIETTSLHFSMDEELRILSSRRELLRFFYQNYHNDAELLDATLQETARYSCGFPLSALHALSVKFLTLASPKDACNYVRKSVVLPGSSSCIEAVSWEAIYGHNEAKAKLRTCAELLNSGNGDESLGQKYRRRGVKPSKGVLLYGPPGTGKTKLAQALATDTDAHFISLFISQLIHAEVGSSEMALKNAFQEARKMQPSIIFIDELDSLVRGEKGSVPERIAMQLLEEMDDVSDEDYQVLILGATNLIESLPVGLLQYGRFGVQIHIGHLSAIERALMIQKELQDILSISVGQDLLLEVLSDTPPMTGAEVCQLLDSLKLLLIDNDLTINVCSKDIGLIVQEKIKQLIS